MAWENSEFALTFRAASAIGQYQPVMFLGDQTAGSALDDAIIPASQSAGPYLGIARGSAPIGGAVTVDLFGVAKGLAGASMGVGALVVAGSTNGALVIATAAAVASNIKYALGKVMKNAAAGDVVPVLLRPEQIV